MDENYDPYQVLRDHEAGVRPRASNPLGIAGFVCSMLGMCAGGLPSPIGLILSIIALRRPPRGFAIAGVVVGAIGSCGVLPLTVGFTLLPALALGTSPMQVLEHPAAMWTATDDMITLEESVRAYQLDNGDLPESLDDLDVSALRIMDPWGNLYVYERQPGLPGYRIRSMGPDGVLDTGDDLDLILH